MIVTYEYIALEQGTGLTYTMAGTWGAKNTAGGIAELTMPHIALNNHNDTSYTGGAPIVQTTGGASINMRIRGGGGFTLHRLVYRINKIVTLN
ncbi:MAG: hypothetical protein WKF70_01125 [Chitinophagaceae bacterium]